MEFSYVRAEELVEMLRFVSPKDVFWLLLKKVGNFLTGSFFVGAVAIWRVEPIAPVDNGLWSDAKHLVIFGGKVSGKEFPFRPDSFGSHGLLLMI